MKITDFWRISPCLALALSATMFMIAMTWRDIGSAVGFFCAYINALGWLIISSQLERLEKTK